MPTTTRPRGHLARPAVVLAVVILLAAGCGSGGGASGGTGSTAGDRLVDIGAGVQGPAGFTARIYTAGPAKQAAYAVDDQGRLWIATADYSDSGTDGVELVTGPGAAPVSVVSGLHTALGLLWHDGALYVSSKERVDVYRGFDGTRFTSTSQVLALPSGVGEVNGLVDGPDGRFHLGISSPCDHCAPTSPYSAAVVSFRPDGSDLRVDAGGIRAPIGLAYVPGTSDLFATMNQRDDLGDATPGDGLGLVRAGQQWGFPDCYGQGGDACAGKATVTATLDPHAAVGSVLMVPGLANSSSVNSSTSPVPALVSEWALGKVQQVVLTPGDGTYTATVSPFLAGITNPLPLARLADGSILVGDWSSGTIFQISTT